MQPTIYTFLIVCPLVFLAGFVDAVAGGGGLISLPAYLLAGVPVHNAVATNKLSSATGTLISTVRLCKNKFVDWILVLPCIPMALLGSSIGAHLALIASDKLLRYMLIPVLPVVAFYVLRKKNMDEKGGEIARKKTDPALCRMLSCCRMLRWILWTRNRNFSPAFVYRIGKNECGKSIRYHEGYQPLF